MIGSAGILSVKWTDIKDLMTYALVTEAHSAGFSFTEEKETAVGLDEGKAGAIFPPAAHFTRVLRLCKQKREIDLNGI